MSCMTTGLATKNNKLIGWKERLMKIIKKFLLIFSLTFPLKLQLLYEQKFSFVW